MAATCRSVSGFVCHRASHFLFSPRLVAWLVKMGYPSMRTPPILQEKAGGQRLPSCFGSSERAKTVVLLEKLSAMLGKHTRITDQILKQAEQVMNLNSFAWSPTTVGAYSLTATDCWEKWTQRPTCSVALHKTTTSLQWLSHQSFVAFLMKYTFFSKLAIE